MRARRRDLAAVLLAVLTAALLTFPPAQRLDALGSDLLLYARHQVFGQRHPAADSRVAVVAIDEETYRTPPFAATPKVLWTPFIAKVLDALLAGGAEVVGFDVIFPTSVEAFLPGFERPFLLALRQGARAGRVVLGMAQHQRAPVAPFPAQSMVVGNLRNIRPLNVRTDVDDVIRHVPLFFASAEQDGPPMPSMALELAARALGVRPEVAADGAVALGGYRIPDSQTNSLRVNFQGGEDVPSYSLADLHACAEAGEEDYFARHFQDKIVLLGTMLDVEDRKLTGKRLITTPEAGTSAPRCRLEQDPSQFTGMRRDTIPGVFIHAAAVNDLLRQDALHTLDGLEAAALRGVAALLIALVVVFTRPLNAALASTALVLLWSLAALGAIQSGWVWPWLSVLLGMLLSFGLMLGYRYRVADQQKARIRRLFGLYLAPAVVNRMVESDRLPELGGETRQVTVWFSDLASFTSLSEGLSAQELVALMNRYFSAMTEIIEAHGGFVDKYIGDAIVAVFGAPHADPDHAAAAVRAVLRAQARLDELNRAGAFGARTIVARTGINTGNALVGNVGSSRRFNYTVMGDMVNMASRLEGANKALGTQILVADSTAAALPEAFILREVDRIRVKGRHEPVTVYEPLATTEMDAERIAQARRLTAISREAHQCLHERHFAEAARLLAGPAQEDQALAILQRRAQALADDPDAAARWDGVNTLHEK